MFAKGVKFIIEGGKAIIGKLGKVTKYIADILTGAGSVVKNLVEGGFTQVAEGRALRKAAKEFTESVGMSMGEILEKGAVSPIKGNPEAASRLTKIIGDMIEVAEPAASRPAVSQGLALRAVAQGVPEGHVIKEVGTEANTAVAEALRELSESPTSSKWAKFGKVVATVGGAGIIAYLVGDLAMEDEEDEEDMYMGDLFGDEEDEAASAGGASSYIAGKMLEEQVEEVLAASAMRVRGLRALLKLLKTADKQLLDQVLDEMSER